MRLSFSGQKGANFLRALRRRGCSSIRYVFSGGYMTELRCTIPKKGRLVLTGWAAAAGGVLAAFCFPVLPLRSGFLCAGAAAALFVWRWSGRFAAAADEHGIGLHARGLFLTERRLRRETVCLAALWATPLLRWAGCRVLILETPAGRCILPGLAKADAEALCRWACRAPGEQDD